MTDYFNFFGLPTLVQELIAEEIVHNSSAETWITFAQTCKASNELVKRSKPKKIIKDIKIFDFAAKIFFSSDSKYHNKFMGDLIEILSNCQIEKIQIMSKNIYNEGIQQRNPEFMSKLTEASRCATKLIVGPQLSEEKLFLHLFEKMKHLEYLDVTYDFSLLEHLTYLPSNLVLGNVELDLLLPLLFKLAEFSNIQPIGSLSITTVIPIDIFQQFLQKTKFQKDAKIYVRVKRSDDFVLLIQMTYIGDNLFEMESIPSNQPLIHVNQRMIDGNKRLLKVSRVIPLSYDSYVQLFPTPLDIFAASDPSKSIYSTCLPVHDPLIFTIDNVNPNDWIKFTSDVVTVRFCYSRKMLNDMFPKRKDPVERVEIINGILGTNITVIKPRLFTRTIEKPATGGEKLLEIISDIFAYIF